MSPELQNQMIAKLNPNKAMRHQSAFLPQNATHPREQYNTSLIAIKMQSTFFKNEEQHEWWLMDLSSIQFETNVEGIEGNSASEKDYL